VGDFEGEGRGVVGTDCQRIGTRMSGCCGIERRYPFIRFTHPLTIPITPPKVRAILKEKSVAL
jgi:hypothetical protein